MHFGPVSGNHGQIKISKGATQIAIMQFSGQSGRYLRQSEVMNFKDSTDKKTVIDRINNMRQMSGDTCIGEALDYFYRSFFSSREDRPPTFSQTV